MIEARNVSKTYDGGSGPPVHALRELDLRVSAGEMVAVMGPSGSGKTTLLALLGGMLAPTSGTVRVAGVDVHDLGAEARTAFRLRCIGFVFQRFRLLDALTVRENVELVVQLAGADDAHARRRADVLLAEVGLTHRAHHAPRTLSGGEQQRVALARALANDAPVVLADEPTGSLDGASGAAVVELLAEVASRGKAVLVASHDTRLAVHAHRVIHLTDGQRCPA